MQKTGGHNRCANSYRQPESLTMMITRRTTILGLLSTSTLAFMPAAASAQSLDELEAGLRKEGEIVSLGLPDDWANWGGQWKDIMAKYGVQHTYTATRRAEKLTKLG